MPNKWPCLPTVCACIELWKAVTIFGSFNIIYSAFMVGAYGYATHKELGSGPLLRGALTYQAAVKLCVAFYCLEIVFSVVLAYGAHRRIIVCLRAFFYYALAVSAGSLMLQAAQFFTMTSRHLDYLLLGLALFGTVFQIYLLLMVKSLLSRFDPTSHQQFENQLDEVVTQWSTTNPIVDNVNESTTQGNPLTKVQNIVNSRAQNGDRKPILVEEIS